MHSPKRQQYKRFLSLFGGFTCELVFKQSKWINVSSLTGAEDGH